MHDWNVVFESEKKKWDCEFFTSIRILSCGTEKLWI